jgi:galactokinase
LQIEKPLAVLQSREGLMQQQRVMGDFRQRFGADPTWVVRAPGRVNLIGEHTDYNDGFVLPLAIDRAVWIALRPAPARRVTAHSLDFNETATFPLDGPERGGAGWVEYLKGVAWALTDAGHRLEAWEGVVGGDVPVGAGLSSSAAVELATARAFAAASGLAWDGAAMAKLGQRAENAWVGVGCGIMDQTIAALGKAGHALLIDCRSLETEAVPLPPHVSVVVLDTNTRRGLVDSAYNERRQQCEAAALYFRVRALRDVTLDRLEGEGGGLDEVTRKRVRHVVTENDRTLRAADAMRNGDAVALGQLMNASHASLRDDFEVSSRELNVMVECARQDEACLGARMTGAGFGGCAVALVRSPAIVDFSEAVTEGYFTATETAARLYVCEATQGAEVVLSSTMASGGTRA